MDAGALDATFAAVSSMVVGDALGDLPAEVQAGVLALALTSAAWARRGGRLRVLAVGACCLMWSRANHAFEGAVLHTFSHDHGLTVADLVPPALAAWVSLARRHPSRAADGIGSATPSVGVSRVPRPRSPHEVPPTSSRSTTERASQ
jgi:hypothetical protein